MLFYTDLTHGCQSHHSIFYIEYVKLVTFITNRMKLALFKGKGCQGVLL